MNWMQLPILRPICWLFGHHWSLHYYAAPGKDKRTCWRCNKIEYLEIRYVTEDELLAALQRDYPR